MNLRHVHDSVLLKDILVHVADERKSLSLVLWHLYEIDQRKLFSDLKCSSLYEYCVKRLKYSEGQASRRVKAARMFIIMPKLDKWIVNGELNLTQVGLLHHLFKEEGITSKLMMEDVVKEIKGKTTRETDIIIDKYRSESSPKKIKITLKQDTVDELYRLRALKAHSCKDMDELIMKMSEEVSKLWNPTYVQRKTKQGAGQSRYVSVQTRAEVWERDVGKCTNCDSIFALEIDHIQPFSMGGKTVTENLRLLCRNCNQRKGNGVPQFKNARVRV